MFFAEEILKHGLVFIEAFGIVLHRRDLRLRNWLLLDVVGASYLLLALFDGVQKFLVHKNIISKPAVSFDTSSTIQMVRAVASKW